MLQAVLTSLAEVEHHVGILLLKDTLGDIFLAVKQKVLRAQDHLGLLNSTVFPYFATAVLGETKFLRGLVLVCLCIRNEPNTNLCLTVRKWIYWIIVGHIDLDKYKTGSSEGLKFWSAENLLKFLSIIFLWVYLSLGLDDEVEKRNCIIRDQLEVLLNEMLVIHYSLKLDLISDIKDKKNEEKDFAFELRRWLSPESLLTSSSGTLSNINNNDFFILAIPHLGEMDDGLYDEKTTLYFGRKNDEINRLDACLKAKTTKLLGLLDKLRHRLSFNYELINCIFFEDKNEENNENIIENDEEIIFASLFDNEVNSTENCNKSTIENNIDYKHFINTVINNKMTEIQNNKKERVIREQKNYTNKTSAHIFKKCLAKFLKNRKRNKTESLHTQQFTFENNTIFENEYGIGMAAKMKKTTTFLETYIGLNDKKHYLKSTFFSGPIIMELIFNCLDQSISNIIACALSCCNKTPSESNKITLEKTPCFIIGFITLSINACLGFRFQHPSLAHPFPQVSLNEHIAKIENGQIKENKEIIENIENKENINPTELELPISEELVIIIANLLRNCRNLIIKLPDFIKYNKSLERSSLLFPYNESLIEGTCVHNMYEKKDKTYLEENQRTDLNRTQCIELIEIVVEVCKCKAVMGMNLRGYWYLLSLK